MPIGSSYIPHPHTNNHHPFHATYSYKLAKLIIPRNPKLPLHNNMPNTPPISNNTHQPLRNILDLIVLMQETDMSLDD